MDDEKEIILIALCNSLNTYLEMLEAAKNMPNVDIELMQYTINRHQEIILKYTREIDKEDDNPTNAIEKPSW
jgi:hypothetical protein